MRLLSSAGVGAPGSAGSLGQRRGTGPGEASDGAGFATGPRDQVADEVTTAVAVVGRSMRSNVYGIRAHRLRGTVHSPWHSREERVHIPGGPPGRGTARDGPRPVRPESAAGALSGVPVVQLEEFVRRGHVEGVRIELAAQPLQQLGTLGVRGIGQHREQPLVAVRTTAVLGRAGAGTVEAPRRPGTDSGQPLTDADV